MWVVLRTPIGYFYAIIDEGSGFYPYTGWAQLAPIEN